MLVVIILKQQINSRCQLPYEFSQTDSNRYIGYERITKQQCLILYYLITRFLIKISSQFGPNKMTYIFVGEELDGGLRGDLDTIN